MEKNHAHVLQLYGPEVPIEDRVRFLTRQLLELDQVRAWKGVVKQELAKPENSLDQLLLLTQSSSRASEGNNAAVGALYRLVDKMGLVSALRRLILDLHYDATQAVHAAATQQSKEKEASFLPHADGGSLDVVQTARESWERITREELLRFASEQGKTLLSSLTNPIRNGTPTSATTTSETIEGDMELNLPNDAAPVRSYKPPTTTRFLYDGRDLLHTLQSIKPSNRSAEAVAAALDAWGSIQLHFHAPSSSALRRQYAELTPSLGQIGLDELFPSERQAFLAEKNRVGDLVLSHHSVSMARQYAKTGCPASLRAQVWSLALGQTVKSPDARVYFEQLQDQVTQWTYLTDDMYLLDLQRAIDSCDYFVFQDHLDSVVMAFTRDPHVHQHALQVNGTVHLTPEQHQVTQTAALPPPNKCVPPNGVLPFSGLVMYVAPLTYLYTDPVQLYYVFREMYIRYWSRLNAIRSDHATILPLCRLFEDLVVRSSSAAVFHLLNVGVQPLDVAFPWIQGAFSGVLELQQLLLLWDRIVGYDSIQLLAVVAAALFHFRADELEGVTSMDEIRALYAEQLEIQVIPLLQEYLFLVS
ncbi:hypothetical protein Poli38472_005044 [Pythium oligandrum]|uniref:Rab-GAP TBC domain-containing protein n=1 Tax=Pythium oligandrum TaxID=41045 RepID=A0A8K1CGL1_PYTOL|nr:hypothetical protein Poli38472_005044 [Pythium oligandrum]|eukprot:TMW62426.1 hypothetical protein Poli38472_005044 [Pythium oligandrum]